MSQPLATGASKGLLYFNEYYVGRPESHVSISFQPTGEDIGSYYIGDSFRFPDGMYGNTSWLTRTMKFSPDGASWVMEERSEGWFSIKNPDTGEYIVPTDRCLSSNVHDDYACEEPSCKH